MAKDGVLSIRIEKEIKKAAEDICAQYGVSLTNAIRMFIAQVARENRLPLAVAEPLEAPAEQA